MWVGKLEAVLEILFEGSVFGKIDFVKCNIIKRDILVEQVERVLMISVMLPPLITVLMKEVLMFSERRIAEACTSISFLKTGLMISEMVQLDGMWMIGNPISFAVRMVSSSRESR